MITSLRYAYIRNIFALRLLIFYVIITYLRYTKFVFLHWRFYVMAYVSPLYIVMWRLNFFIIFFESYYF